MFDFGKSRFYKKCKPLLKLSKTRVDTIKKKKNAVHRYLKNDIAELLKCGLDVNAYGRVEGLLVELNMAFCYNYIDQCIMSLSGQLSAMSNQRECPNDCREAVASLIHAAARFADLPELRDLRTAFMERYGNSLEPFVNQEFVMKLRSDHPATEKKLQLMQEIAQEFSIQWDPKSLEQKMFKPSPTPTAQDQSRHRSSNDLEDDKCNHHKRKDDILPGSVGHSRENKMSELKEYDVPERNGKDLKYHGRKDSPDDRYNVPSSSEDEVFASRRNSISQDSQLTSSSSAGSFSEDEVDRKPFNYGTISPPYVKQNATKESTTKEDTIESNGFVNAQQKNLHYPRGYKDQLEPVSARKSTLKPPPGRQVIGKGNEDRAKGEKARQRVQSMLKEYDEDHSDEEEKKLDQLLVYYSGKKPPPESSKVKANQYLHPGQEDDHTSGCTGHIRDRANQYHPPQQGNEDTSEGRWYRSRRANRHTPAHENGHYTEAGRQKSARPNQYFPSVQQFDETVEAARHRSVKSELPHPPARATSIPSEPAAAHEAIRAHGRAKSLEPEILTGPGHVHPKLPDYDNLAARLAALRGK